MNTRSKVRIYKTSARTVMINATKTGAENTTTKRFLRKAEMRTLRAMAGYTLFDHKRNKEIREICEGKI